MIAIIGAGPAGIEAAYTLAMQGQQVDVFEQASDILGNLRDKAFLFPNFASATDMVEDIRSKTKHANITIHVSTDIIDIKQVEKQWQLISAKGDNYTADAVLLATGYTAFDARRKEELGYGIYDGVVTSLDMEQMLREQKVVNTIGDKPRRITFLQCVGSRDIKTGNNYCSKVCCITATKQAMEVRKLLPDTEIYVFYMDLRMWGQGFEELYRRSQEECDVRYVRGRISEAAGTFDGRVQIKAEDTLTGLPLKMATDLLVLMVGMEASAGTKNLSEKCAICGQYGFAESKNPHLADNFTDKDGIYVAGSCKRPMSLTDSISDARSAAIAMLEQIQKQK